MQCRREVVLNLKVPWRSGTTHLAMSPLEFMQRVVTLVARPRLHRIRLPGVLATNAASTASCARSEDVRPVAFALAASAVCCWGSSRA